MSQPPAFPPPPSDPDPPPALDPSVVADEEALADAVDALIAADHEARERLAEIGVYVDALRCGLDADTWRQFLRVDELTTARWADLAVNLARWAFNEGARSAGLPKAGA